MCCVLTTVKTIARLLLTNTQFIIWSTKLREAATQKAQENMQRNDGDPLQTVGVAQLLGEGGFITPEAQTSIPRDSLTQHKPLHITPF